MAVTYTLLSATPHVVGGDLRRAVQAWDFVVGFQNGESGDSDYLYKEYSAHCPVGIIENILGAPTKPAADFTRVELESLCLIEQWNADFCTLSAEQIKPDTSYTLPS